MQPRILDEKQTSVYKRALDKEYKLKLKASRATLSEINQRFPVMPFTIRWAPVGVLTVVLTSEMSIYGTIRCTAAFLSVTSLNALHY